MKLHASKLGIKCIGNKEQKTRQEHNSNSHALHCWCVCVCVCVCCQDDFGMREKQEGACTSRENVNAQGPCVRSAKKTVYDQDVLILLYMCPHSPIYVCIQLLQLYMCLYICVLILLYMSAYNYCSYICPHTAISVCSHDTANGDEGEKHGLDEASRQIQMRLRASDR